MSTMYHSCCPECGSTDLYSGRGHRGIVVDEEYVFGCHICDWYVDIRSQRGKKLIESKTTRTEMSKSLKLDRTLVVLTTGEVYKNAFQFWKANPAVLTSAQVDRLTATLYKAAKNGVKEIVTISGFEFQLANVAV